MRSPERERRSAWYLIDRNEQQAASTRHRDDHSGSTFSSFLEEEGIRNEVVAVALKRVIAWQLEQGMREQGKTKLALAKKLHTSRSQLDWLLDPHNTTVSLAAIARAVSALGKRLSIQVVDRKPTRSRVA